MDVSIGVRLNPLDVPHIQPDATESHLLVPQHYLLRPPTLCAWSVPIREHSKAWPYSTYILFLVMVGHKRTRLVAPSVGRISVCFVVRVGDVDS